EDHTQAQEKKPDHFVPQDTRRLHHSRHNMLDELRPMAHCDALPHEIILTFLCGWRLCGPIVPIVVLVKGGCLHYNRIGWVRTNNGTLERRQLSAHPFLWEQFVDEPLKNLMQELGKAINDSLSESDRIAEAIGEIKRAGYDVFLVLEATIGFNRRDET